MAIVPLLIGPVSELLNTVLKRVLPAEKMTDAQRAQLEAEMLLELHKADWTRVEAEFKDRDSARQLAAADVARGNWASNFLAATVRPVWGYASLVVVAYPYLAGALGWPAVTLDDSTTEIVKLVIMFFFGGRTVEKILTMRQAAKA